MAIDDSFYTDQGLDFMPRIKYLLNPPTEEDKEDNNEVENLIVNAGIPTKNIIGGGGISSVSPATTLLEDFSRATTNRQNKLTNPDGLASMLYNFGLPQQRSVDQMKRDATAYNMAQLGPDFKQIGITSNMSKPS